VLTFVAPLETVAAMVMSEKSLQALNEGVRLDAFAPDDGCCQMRWKETPPVLEAGVPESFELFEQDEIINTRQIAKRQSEE
jgi:hypothetical protein